MNYPATDEDVAWAKMSLPLAPAELLDFLADAERVLRINPCLEFEHLLALPDGKLRMAGRNDSTARAFDTEVERVADADGMGYTLRYGSGIKRETRFAITPDPQGAVLAITEVYDTPPDAERERRLMEVDRSLLPWASALRTHVLRRARWGRVPGYTWLVERFWLGMPPRQRRVAWLIIWTTALEFLVFLAVLAVYVVR